MNYMWGEDRTVWNPFLTTIYLITNFRNVLHTENSEEITLEYHYSDYSLLYTHVKHNIFISHRSNTIIALI